MNSLICKVLVLSLSVITAISTPSKLEKRGIAVCKKNSYSRGIGRIHETCPDGWYRIAGLCYRRCEPDYAPSTLTFCQLQCKAEYPVDCGAAYCAKTKSDCAKIVSFISGAAVGGAVLPFAAWEALPFVGETVANVGVATAGTLTGLEAENINYHTGDCPWGRFTA